MGILDTRLRRQPSAIRRFDPVARSQRGDRLRDPRQGRVHESGRVGRRPRGARRIVIVDAEQRGELRPGGSVVEVHRRQYRHWPGACLQRTRGYRCIIVMPDNPVPGKVPPARDARRRALQGSGRSVQQSEPVSEGVAAPRRLAALQQCDLGQPVRQPDQSPRATSRPRDRRSGNRPTARSMYALLVKPPAAPAALSGRQLRNILQEPATARCAACWRRSTGQQPVRVRCAMATLKVQPAVARSPKGIGNPAPHPTAQLQGRAGG